MTGRAETLDRGVHRDLHAGRIGHVEPYREQVLGGADRLLDVLRVTAGRDDRVPGGQSRLRDVHAQATPGTGDQQNLLLRHVILV
jgi:hypothetical protein